MSVEATKNFYSELNFLVKNEIKWQSYFYSLNKNDMDNPFDIYSIFFKKDKLALLIKDTIKNSISKYQKSKIEVKDYVPNNLKNVIDCISLNNSNSNDKEYQNILDIKEKLMNSIEESIGYNKSIEKINGTIFYGLSKEEEKQKSYILVIIGNPIKQFRSPYIFGRENELIELNQNIINIGYYFQILITEDNCYFYGSYAPNFLFLESVHLYNKKDIQSKFKKCSDLFCGNLNFPKCNNSTYTYIQNVSGHNLSGAIKKIIEDYKANPKNPDIRKLKIINNKININDMESFEFLLSCLAGKVSATGWLRGSINPDKNTKFVSQ